MKGLFGILFFWIGIMALPALALATDPPTCGVSQKRGTPSTHQVLCYGETITLSATSSAEYSSLQWYRQNQNGSWAVLSGEEEEDLMAGQGIYKVIFTFWDNSTCETNADTVSYWKAYQIDWEVSACRASISGVMALPFPQQNDGSEEMSYPVDPNAEINYSWQIIPAPVSSELATSSSSLFPLEGGSFMDTTLGLHKVVLTVSQQGSSCISVDTMEVTLLPLNVWADTIISYNGQPAIAVAHASGGTGPYQFTWSIVDSCLTPNCDSAFVSHSSNYAIGLLVMDHENCWVNTNIFAKDVYSPCYSMPLSLDYQEPDWENLDTTELPELPPIIKIPVVFTILSQNDSQIADAKMVTDELVFSQINLLNQVFSGQIPDPLSLIPEFRDILAFRTNIDPNEGYVSTPSFQFELAERDECGLPINGIRRVSNELTFGFYNLIHPDGQINYNNVNDLVSSFFGAKPLNTKKILNIYVCEINGGTKGVFLGKDPSNHYNCQNEIMNRDIVVVDWKYFGVFVSPDLQIHPNSDFNGRVCVHEMGHYLGLFHMTGKCNNYDEDLCEDTPKSIEPEVWTDMNSCFDRENFEGLRCGELPMPENYMQYTGHCSSMFTNDQAVRMARNFYSQSRRREMLNPLPESFQVPDFTISVNPCTGVVQITFVNDCGCGSATFSAPGGALQMNPLVYKPYCQIGYTQTGTATYSQSGVYSIIMNFTDSQGGIHQVTKQVTIVKTGVGIGLIQISPDGNICQGADISISIPPIEGASYSWVLYYGAQNQPVQNQSNTLLIPASQTSGLTQVVLQVQVCGNWQTVNIPITIHPTPQISVAVGGPICETSTMAALASLNPTLSGVTYIWEKGTITNGIFSGQIIPGANQNYVSELIEVNAPNLQIEVAYKVTASTNFCASFAQGAGLVYNQIFSSAPGVTYSIDGGASATWSPSQTGELEITICPGSEISFGPVTPQLEDGMQWFGSYVWEGAEGEYPLFSSSIPGVYTITVRTANGPCESPVRTIHVTVLPTGTLALTPYCDENGRYVRVSGGTPPYFIKKTTQANFTEMDISDPNDATAYLFAYAGPDSPLDPGLAGDYLVKDSGPGTCGNLTPFKIWGNYGTLPHVEMHGVNFVQFDLTFNKATIADGATVYMYGTHQYHSGSTPGGTVGGASLIKTGTGDFIIGNGAKITSQCGEMWPGIKINNSDLYQRVIGDGARIEHAETAFDFLNPNGTTKLTLSACTLANNFNGIRIHQNNLTNWIMTNSIMYTDENGLLPPFDDARNSSLGSDKTFEGNYGIQFVKGNGTATNSLSLTGTTIRNYMVGIEGYGAWFSADNCIFDKIRLAGINSYVSSFTGNPITINHCSFSLNAADAFTSQRTALRNDANFVANSNLEPIGTFGIVVSNVPFAITGNTTFEGKTGIFDDNKPRVGYHSNVSETIERNTFKNLDFGYFNEGVTGSLSLQGTTFENNTQSIYLNGGQIALELRCNKFITDDALARVGLRIGSGVTIENDGIGGNGGIDQPLPNANIWPRKSNVTPAESPDNWVSIQKPDAGGELFYYRYTNEFIGYFEPNSGLNQIQFPASLTAKSPKAVREWCEANFTGNDYITCLVNPSEMVGWNSDWVAVCDNLDDQLEYFPARQSVANSITALLPEVGNDQIYLGTPVPNPSKETATIGLNWPKEKGTLIVFEIASGKKVWQTEVSNGRQQVLVPVKQLAAGVYGYRLEGECPCPEPKRLIVIH